MAKKFLFVNTSGDYEQGSDTWEQSDFLTTSAGAGSVGLPIKLDSDGHVDATMINDSDISHSGLTGAHNLTSDIDHDQLTNTHNLTSDIDHDQTSNFLADEHIDWTGDAGGDNINDANLPTVLLMDGTRALTGDWTVDGTNTYTIKLGKAPASSTDLVNKAYADAIASGFGPKRAVRLTTTSLLDAAYDNGTAGVDATLTYDGGTQAALSLDGVATAVSDRILVKDQVAYHVGDFDISGGDSTWTGAPASFLISKDGGSTDEITLDTNTTDVATTVTEINDSLATANVDSDYEAYDAGNNYVGIRSLDNTVGDITLAAGGTDALVDLGWTAATYENIQNGIYVVTTIGSGASNWVLTRSDDCDNSPDGEILPGDFVPVEEGTAYSGWQFYQVAFTSAGVVGTDGITFSFFSNPSDLVAGDGVDITAGAIIVDVTDLLGSGLTETSNNIDIDWSSTFAEGSKAIQASHLASVSNGEGASIIGLEDTGGYTTQTDVEGALAEIYANIDTGLTGVTYTAGTGGVNKGDLLYVSANNTVLPYDTITTAQVCIGVAETSESQTAQVKVLSNDVAVASVLTGATAGAKYYWDGTNGWITSIGTFSSGEYIYQGGVAKNATDMHVEISYVMKKA